MWLKYLWHSLAVTSFVVRFVCFCLYLWKICISHHQGVQPTTSQISGTWSSNLLGQLVEESRLKKISREFLKLYEDLQIPKIKEGVGTLLIPCATSNLSKNVSLIERVHKGLENSIAEFTGYWKSCVCVHQKKLYSWKWMLYTKCFGRNIYYLHISGNSCLSFTKLS